MKENFVVLSALVHTAYHSGHDEWWRCWLVHVRHSHINPFAVGIIFTARHHVLRNSLKMLDNVAKIKARNNLFIIGNIERVLVA